jgi:sigma-B regulation protein RsbU (phosphoserine phosphatase)
MVMAVVHSLFRMACSHENNPARVMQTVNETSCEGNESNMFVTMFVGVLDLPTGRLRYCNAGHDRPVIVGAEALPAKANLPVGVFADFVFEMQETVLTDGSTLFLYTDGLTEAKNRERQMFGVERVMDVLNGSADLKPAQLLEKMEREVHAFVEDAEQSDDLTMLAIHYTPKQFDSKLTETLVLKNDVHEVTRFSNFIKSVLEQLGIEKSLARKLRLAVEEAVVNVIDYAYPLGSEGDITIHVMSDGHSIRFKIIDAGVAFDPTAKEKADTTLSIDDRQIGGLGILLVRELMDTINYEREDGQNILTLIKNL